MAASPEQRLLDRRDGNPVALGHVLGEQLLRLVHDESVDERPLGTVARDLEDVGAGAR